MKITVDCGAPLKMTSSSGKIDGTCCCRASEETSAQKILNNVEQGICNFKEDEKERENETEKEYVGMAFTEHDDFTPHLSDRKRNSCYQENVTQEETDEENVSGKKPKYEALKQFMEAECVENSLKACLEAVEEYNRRDGQLKDMDYHLVLAKAKLTIAQAEGEKVVVAKGLEQITEGLKWFKLICDQLKELEKQFADSKQRERQQKSKGKPKDEITDNLKHTKKMLEEKLEHQCDRLKEIQREYGLVKAEYEFVAEERSKVWKKELQGLRQVLRKYEAAYRRFNEVFGGEEETGVDLEFSAIEESASKQTLDVDDTQNCSICMEPWTQSGEHNICVNFLYQGSVWHLTAFKNISFAHLIKA
ncbi:stress response protein nst1 isoform X2 [Cryptomeria japonica]|uniref:stress response protein nst1 isoform X2 n=1 Tax=Cryptomeria japonica TaxID=3369 RepID=UPI0027DA8116|nr:stress response protein nst1 isoform X2 [Cryptomeria japonica]